MSSAASDHNAPTLVAPDADVEALQLQLSSLQLSLDTNRNSMPDLRRMTEVTLCSIAAQFSPVLPSLPSVSYLKDTCGRYVYVSELWLDQGQLVSIASTLADDEAELVTDAVTRAVLTVGRAAMPELARI